MGSIIKLVICIYILSLIFSMICGLFRFLIDIGKWHDKEKKVIIENSKKGGELNGRDYYIKRAAGDTGDKDNNDSIDGDSAGDNADTGRAEPLIF